MIYPPFVPDPHPDRLLVVDDLQDNALLIEDILKEGGYHQVEIKNDGRSALASVHANPPDLVLLDVMMPEMDGYEVTQRIRAQRGLPFIPILLITAHDHPSIVKGLDSGADEFIRKPVKVEELLARVRSLLRLKHSIDERDRTARMREDFVSRLTHDLRTPLVAADLVLSLLLDAPIDQQQPEEVIEALRSLSRSNQNLLELVNNLLQVYRFEAGKQRLNFGSVAMGTIVKNVARDLRPLAQEKGLTMELQIESILPILRGDRLELQRVVTNLVSNAIKFTDAGTVTLSVQSQPAPRTGPVSPPYVILKVQDTGIGIATEDQPFLFERFRPGHDQRAGSGLGLHLSQYIVQAHGGDIKVESEQYQGSCFTVRFPVKQQR